MGTRGGGGDSGLPQPGSGDATPTVITAQGCVPESEPMEHRENGGGGPGLGGDSDL